MRDIKRSPAIYINKKKIFLYGSKWQEGYGAVTVGYKELDAEVSLSLLLAVPLCISV